MGTLIICSILLFTVLFLFHKKIGKNNKWFPINDNNIFKLLLALTLIGFLFRLDYTQAGGCIVFHEPILENQNILYSSISFILLLSGLLSNRKSIKIFLLSTETIYWIAKLMIVKGGYAIGFGGATDGLIVLFDLGSIVLRLYLIFSLLSIKRFKYIKVGIIAMLVMFIKISFFKLPYIEVYRYKHAREKGKEMRKELIGVWNGRVEKLDTDSLQIRDTITLIIDSTKIQFESSVGLSGDYFINFESTEYGSIYNSIDSTHYFFNVDSSAQDYLYFEVSKMTNRYQYTLTRKVEK